MLKGLLLIGLCIGIVWELKHFFFGPTCINFPSKWKKVLSSASYKTFRTVELKAKIKEALQCATPWSYIMELEKEQKALELTTDEKQKMMMNVLAALWGVFHGIFEFFLLVAIASITGYWYAFALLGLYLIAILLGIPVFNNSVKRWKDCKTVEDFEKNFERDARRLSFSYFRRQIHTLLTITVYVLVVLQLYMGINLIGHYVNTGM